MKSKLHANQYVLPLAMLALCSMLLVSWGNKQKLPQTGQKVNSDTVPRERKIRDLDDAIRELDRVDISTEMKKAMQEMHRSMQNIDIEKMKGDMERSLQEVDIQKIKAEIQKSMQEIDLQKMKVDLQKAMSEIDVEKMKKDIDGSLSQIDKEKIKAEIEKNFDAAKIKAEVESSLSKIDMEKWKSEIDQVKIDKEKLHKEMKEFQEEMKDLGPKLQKELEKAKVDIEKAKKELKEYKTFVDGLEKDGLINKEEYVIRHKDGELFINGKKQPADVYNKYRSFLESHKKFVIRKTVDGFDMNNNDHEEL
jgi:DNA repair exonuclease SbcCD ATPase subunit